MKKPLGLMVFGVAGGIALTVSAQEANEPTALEEIVVQGYRTGNEATVTKTSTPVAEMPIAVQIVPRSVLEDQAAQGLEDLFSNMSGIVESGNTLNAQSEVRPVIRGFESDLLFRNGMRSTNVGAVDLVNVESVESLKGPASILFGAIEPGGVLNYNTKRPQVDPAVELSQQLGTYDHIRSTLDATGPVNRAETVLYRVNAAYTDSGSFRDTVDRDTSTLAPSFMFHPTERTQLLLDLSFTREEVPFDSGVPFSADNEPLVSRDTFFGDSDLQGQRLEDYFASYQLSHEFNDMLTLRNQFQFHRVDAHNETIRNRGVEGPPGAEMLGRRYQNLNALEDEYQFVTDLIAETRTGDVEHEILVGLELVSRDQDNRRYRQNLDPIAISDNPVTDFVPPADQPREVQLGESRWSALYVQDQMTLLGDRLHVLVGGRFDDFHSEFEEDGEASPDVDESEFTGRVGALYDLTDWAAPYASVSQSFNPQGSSAVDASNDVLAPEEGLQYEMGVKFGFLQDRITSTLSAFTIEKENVAVFNLPYFLETGEVAFTSSNQRSRGLELDATGQISDQLRLIANYVYADTEVLENRADPAMEGRRLGNVPEHSARVWLAYDLPDDDALNGFGVGAGVRHESDRKAQFDATRLEEFTTFDAALWYRRALSGNRMLSAQLNIKNLTDEEFYPRASDQSIVHPGEPRQVTGTLRWRF